MTTAVLTPKFILSDCRVTSTITVKDQQGTEHKVKGSTDTYSKQGDLNIREPEGDHNLEAYVIFGEIPTAEALVALAKATGFVNITMVLAAVAMFNIKVPTTPTGFAWVNGSGRIGWLIIEDGQYLLGYAPEGTEYVCFGSGKGYFEASYERTGDILTAFTQAIHRDPLSSDLTYDHHDVESGVTSRMVLSQAEVPTLETLLPVLDATA
ncbi:hypothetical protein FDI21_gp227 [Pseudomonas phage Noxifer]|uniref:Uncharacterized protein n=1 Tax=Pseudomonas phage Noxifer TaxID=2006684 RepID=A0A1Y0SXX4_9CAUD|nr:hypothetical protein FDI21_gp227 [Pseudomonas phage Noxifer]ARV77484.1 hypothetical protein NOXIFER_319 [Pseudomonas phage Noxifer]